MRSIKKLFLAVAIFTTALFFSAPSVKAATIEELQALIASLTAQIAALTQQLAQLQGGTTTTAWCHTFNKSLKIGDSGSEVGYLVTALIKEGVLGSAKSGTTEYSEEIAAAVTAFQERYASEVLTPVGLKNGSGYAGPSTRAKLNNIYGCSSTVTCQNLWWYDNSTKVCSQKQFCGAYMYYGLQTFNTQDECNANLNSTSPSITVISPNGGQVWTIGQKYDITWQSKGVNAVGIQWELYNLDGSRIAAKKIAFNIAASIGTYSWTVPSTLIASTTYKILIWDITKPDVVEDVSDNYISIAEASSDYKCTDSDNGKNYYIKGTTVDNSNSRTDSCYDPTIGLVYSCSGSNCAMEEYYCGTDNKVYQDLNYYACPNGCENGVCKTASNSSITVTSPNGGETLTTGQTYTIAWSSPNIAKPKVDLYKDGVWKTMIATFLTTTQSYSWTVPTSLEEGADYKIRVSNYLDSSNYDESNSYFSIVKDTTCSTYTCSSLSTSYLSTLQKFDTDKNGLISMLETLAVVNSYKYGATTKDEFCMIQSAYQNSCNFNTSISVESGVLSVTKNVSTSISSQVTAGTAGVEFTKINLTADSKENLSVNKIQVTATLDNSSPTSSITNISLWDGSTKIGSTIPALNSSGQATFDLANNPLIIPASGIKTLTIKADITAAPYIISGGTVSLDIPVNGVFYKGQTSGVSNTAPSVAVSGNAMYVYKTKLTFAVNSISPSGTAYAGSAKTVMVFNATNNGSYSAYLNGVTFSVNYTPSAGGYSTTQAERTFYLYDYADLNNYIATVNIPAGQAYNGLTVAPMLISAYSSTGYEITAGAAKTFVLVGDTTDMGVGSAGTDRYLQFYINDGTKVAWSDGFSSSISSVYTKTFPIYGGSLKYSAMEINNLDKQLADISQAISGLMAQIKNLLNR